MSLPGADFATEEETPSCSKVAHSGDRPPGENSTRITQLTFTSRDSGSFDKACPSQPLYFPRPMKELPSNDFPGLFSYLSSWLEAQEQAFQSQTTYLEAAMKRCVDKAFSEHATSIAQSPQGARPKINRGFTTQQTNTRMSLAMAGMDQRKKRQSVKIKAPGHPKRTVILADTADDSRASQASSASSPSLKPNAVSSPSVAKSPVSVRPPKTVVPVSPSPEESPLNPQKTKNTEKTEKGLNVSAESKGQDPKGFGSGSKSLTDSATSSQPVADKTNTGNTLSSWTTQKTAGVSPIKSNGTNGRETKMLRFTQVVSDLKFAAAEHQNKMLDKSQQLSASRQRKSQYASILTVVCHWLSNNRYFDYVVACVIMLNAVYIGVQADWNVKNPGAAKPPEFRVFEYIFTVVFSSELLIRIVAEHSGFFSLSNKNLSWNCFDSFVVMSSLFEIIFESLSASTGGGGPNMSAIRLLRILRLIRVVRIIRVLRFFRELRLMVFGIMSSMKSLMWCILLLVLIMFMFGVVVVQVTADELSATTSNVDEENMSALKENFGSMLSAIYTLMLCISNGVDWGSAAYPLLKISPAFALFFTVYICFAVFCVLNIVTGVFVENSHKLSMQDEDHVVMEEIVVRQRHMEEIKKVFENADKDEDGALDWEEFERTIDDARMRTYFRKLGVDVESISPSSLFLLFDVGSDGTVDVDEFLQACLSLGGHARQLDLVRMRHENKRTLEGVDRLLQYLMSENGALDAIDEGAPNVRWTNVSESQPKSDSETLI